MSASAKQREEAVGFIFNALNVAFETLSIMAGEIPVCIISPIIFHGSEMEFSELCIDIDYENPNPVLEKLAENIYNEYCVNQGQKVHRVGLESICETANGSHAFIIKFGKSIS